MTEPITVGWTPIEIVPIIVAGQDWIATFEADDDTTAPIFPDGTNAVAALYNDDRRETVLAGPVTTWPCDVDDRAIGIRVESTEHEIVTEGQFIRIEVHYPDVAPRTDDYVWAQGTVVFR